MNLISISRYTALAVIITCFSSHVYAELSPHTKASRYAHLVEINDRWLQEVSPQYLLEEVKYQSEVDRIADHLFRVASALENREICDLSKEQLANRQQALALLRAYAKTGKFPINAHHDERTPYFVDELGTHCAVGHLMQETGASATVEAIRTKTNYGYVLEELSVYPEVGDWGTANGFTNEELAWIQPTYLSLAFSAREFGNNLGVTGGSVYTAETDQEGFFLAGSFTVVDGIFAAGLAYLFNETVEEIVQPYPTVKALLYDTLREVLYAHGIDPVTNEAGVFTLDNSRAVSVLSLPLTLNDSVHLELTATGVAIARQRTDTSMQATFYHHTLTGGVAQIASQTDWQGTVYDIKTWGDTLAIGGNFIAYQNGERVDSNCAYLSLTTETLLPDTDSIQIYLGNFDIENVPGAPIIIDFFDARGDDWDNFILNANPSGDTIQVGYFYRKGHFEQSWFDPITVVPTPWTFPTVIFNATTDGDGSILVSGQQGPIPWIGSDPIRSVIYWWESASFGGTQFNCDGRIMALPRIGDSLLIVGNFSELAGQSIQDIGFAQSRLSDSEEPLAKEDYNCYVTNGEIVVSFSNPLTERATLHLYTIDGRHIRENVLTAGQTEFRFPSVDQRLMSYAIQTEQGVAAGILVSVQN